MQNLNTNLKIRRDYSKIKSAEEIPDLIEMQKQSYDKFLQIDLPKNKRVNVGLQSALKTIFPIYSNDGRYFLEYLEYALDEPRYSIEESRQKGVNYSAPLKLKLRLTVNDVNKETGSIVVKEVIDQDVYVCDLPMMTHNGTFVINGTERVIVSQIYRSPGVFFDHDKGKNTNGKLLYGASIIPHLGSWLDVEFDSKDLLYVRIDKRKKIPLTCLLKSLFSDKTEALTVKATKEGKVLDASLVSGMTNDEILSTFYKHLEVSHKDGIYVMKFIPQFYIGRKLPFALKNSDTKEILVEQDTTISNAIIRKIERSGLKNVELIDTELFGRYIANTIVDAKGEIILDAGAEITKEVLELLINNSINNFKILLIDNINVGSYILNTLLADKIDNRFRALNEIYGIVKSSDAPNIDVAEELFFNLFFNPTRYDLSEVGRVKINEKFHTPNISERVLTKVDIINVIKTLLEIRDGHDQVDDIDHLGNRRVRSVGELVENEIRIAFVRMERAIQEKMASVIDAVPNDLVNVKAVQAILREFFGSSQLSQFMDQTNPLSEITHKRRLSALGPKGLTRDRANFEVRDVHVTHYGRICPIETPEGPNIGLINSLAVFARVNKYGFLETPYRKVENGIVLDEIVYMNATAEGNSAIAQSTMQLGKDGRFLDTLINCRINGELVLCSPEEVQYMDVSPKQLVSVAASLVPFLENDDANRALMGANMQRQAVPLLRTEAPIVGTGMEGVVARDSGVVIIAKRSGRIHKADASKIIVKISEDGSDISYGVDIYNLKKFQRSNHNTCINQKPIVKVGDYVKVGDIIADGHSIDKGELALGKNVLVAFMPWNGYNFEDSILISERIVKDDVFTSVHIEEFEAVARDTKLGAEEITADIPNIGDEALKNLDEAGIIYVGAEVKQGDILVGKVTPKAESVVTAEEKLLRAIFGEKSVDVKDTSLKVPSGISGTVIDVRVFSRRGIDKDTRTQSIERETIERFSLEKEEEYNIIETSYLLRAIELLQRTEVISGNSLTKGTVLTKAILAELSLSDLFKISVKDKEITNSLLDLYKEFELSITKLNTKFTDKIDNLGKGDDLPAGVLKMVKVFIAVKRKLQPGDKMAGRHGNKGVVSKILPIEDMPHLEDGTPVDLCLNPLGVPSRMNVGQVLEVHMGWACRTIGQNVSQMLNAYYSDKANLPEIRQYLESCYGANEIEQVKNLTDDEVVILSKNLAKGLPIATPVFDGVREKDIDELFDLNNIENSGQMQLVDGRTGEFFERKVTVGYIYMLKLHHLVDDKIHARSIGPYSLITQQPLGGKAQFGGQRFGEMEVWALEAYGAAYILQEMLTVKSDDQAGRTHVYESIIKGDETFETGIPESFNVLVKELRSLCLNLEMKKLEE